MINYSDNLIAIVHKILRENEDFINIIRERAYTIKDTGFTYRQLNVLDEAGLVDKTRKSDKQWRTFNMIDLLYLHLVKQLKGFDVKNDKLSYIQQLFYKRSMHLKDVKESIALSEIALIGLLLQDVPIGVLVFQDGEAVLTDKPNIMYLQGHLDIKKRSYLFIMLYETFKEKVELILQDERIKDKIDFDLYQSLYVAYPISRREKTLLEFIKHNKYSKITIEKKPKGHFFVKGEGISELDNITNDDLLKLINSKEFGQLVIHKDNNSIDFIMETDAVKI